MNNLKMLPWQPRGEKFYTSHIKCKIFAQLVSTCKLTKFYRSINIQLVFRAQKHNICNKMAINPLPANKESLGLSR